MFISAIHRETTRALLDRIAELLAGRWAESARSFREPEMAEAADPEANAPDVEKVGDEHALTTLDEMLGKKSRRRSRTPVSV